MRRLLQRMWCEDDGVLTFEWVLLVTLLTIGVVGGIAAARDAIIDELGDVAQAMLALDQSYTILHPLMVEVRATRSLLMRRYFRIAIAMTTSGARQATQTWISTHRHSEFLVH